MANKILVVDDDELVRRSLKFRLEQEGYRVTTADCGEDALSFARRDLPDLVLLDIGLPDRDGLDVARTLKREINVPIIFLTARGEENDIVVGLELGAEDYVTKPFGTRELSARIRAALRRAERASEVSAEEALRIGPIKLNPRSREVNVRGKDVHLRPKEFDLLRLLMANAGTVLTTDYLLDAVWGEEFAGAVQVLYVYMGWLRERVEEDPRRPRYIQTVRGVGYRFTAAEAEQ
ncbi:MAG: response regulator transcription factor [Chloroflexota bacterium]